MDSFRFILQAMRVHHYVKNILILVPLFVSYSFLNIPLVISSLMGMLIFCLLASSGYLINDLLDLASDRRHPQKCHRPIASGELGIVVAITLASALIFCVIALSSLIPLSARYVLIAYFTMTILYSLVLKQLFIIDVCLLAGMYTVRVVYGAMLIQVPLTEWFLLFSLFSFLSLALLKRYTELLLFTQDKSEKLIRRGYKNEHIQLIRFFGLLSGYLSVVVFGFYLGSDNAQSLYRQPAMLWMICPLLIFWVSRIWRLAREKKVHQDPIVFAIQDRTSYIVVLLVVTIGIVAHF